MRDVLDTRSRALLKTLIERYIADGQPVGSRTLSKFSGLDLSPATIRNVMADLEDLGLVASPHTSAGRIPTPRGYRLFVDKLLTVQPMERAAKHQLQDQLHPDQPQRVLATAAQVLSELSQFAGVVLTPRRAGVFRHIEFLLLSERRILLIVVTPEGDVQNRLILTDQKFSAAELIEAANFLNQHYSGQALDDVRGRLCSELVSLKSHLAELMQQAMDASSEALGDSQETVVISGERKLLNVADFSDDMGRLRRLFDMFAKKTQLMRLLDASSSADGVQIYIGGESQLVPIEQLTVVTAPYEVHGQIVGTLGVIGPTRMDYERVIPIVDITSRLVSSALSREF